MEDQLHRLRVIAMSYGRIDGETDRLIGEQNDSQFTLQMEREQVKTEDIYLVAMQGLRIKMIVPYP